MLTNCYTFNGFDHPVSQNAKVLEKLLNKEMPALQKKEEQVRQQQQQQVPPAASPAATATAAASSSASPATKRPTPSGSSKTSGSSKASGAKAELRKYKQVLDKLQNHPHYYAFGAPVDPVLLQVPTYFDIIKHPMDFGTMRTKFEQGKYTEPAQLLKDAEQVFINCYTFNLPDDVVYQMGIELENEFNKLCAAKALKTSDALSKVPPPAPVVMPPSEETPVQLMPPAHGLLTSDGKRGFQQYDDEYDDYYDPSKRPKINES